MKDYEHVVVWLDYFNKTLTRNKGRKLSKEKCVFDPSLKELIDAAKAAKLELTESDDKVRFPKDHLSDLDTSSYQKMDQRQKC